MQKILSLFIVGLVTILLTGCWDTGGGEKIGSITRLNLQGVFYKTWEAEIIRGGLNSGSGVIGQAFHFTIEDDSLAKEVEKAMNSQQEVKITYRRELMTWGRSDSGDVFLTKIEPLHTDAISTIKASDGTNAATNLAGGQGGTNLPMDPNLSTIQVEVAASPSKNVADSDSSGVANSSALNQKYTTTAANTTAVPSSAEILKVIKRQQDELEKSQKLMQQMLDERKK